MRSVALLLAVVVGGGCMAMETAGLDGIEGSSPPPVVAHIVNLAPERTGEPTCLPTGDGPYWIEEERELRFRVRCATGAPTPGGGFEVSALPPGAVFDRDTSELEWTPELNQAAVYFVQLATPDGETGTVKIGVADRFDVANNDPIAAATAYSEEMGLPVFHLALDPGVNADDYTPATITYRGKVFRGEAKHRGNSSLAYPKKNFTLKFPKHDRFHDPERGFVQRRKVVLSSNFDDNSHLRQRLSFEVWNRLGEGKIEVRQASAVVFVDGRYAGLYALTDHVDGDLMEHHGLDEDGELFKSVGPDANFYRNHLLWNIYVKKEGYPVEGEPGAFDSLIALTNWIMQTDDARFGAEVGDVLDLRDYRAWFVLVTAIQARDTLGKNAYHYRAPGGGRWRVVPWDFNHSWGQDWMTVREPPTVDPALLAGNNLLFWRLLSHPELGPETRARYAHAITAEVPVADVLALLDEMANEVREAARRDERLWRVHHLAFDRWSVRTDFTDFDAEVAYMRRWIAERWATLAGQP